MKSKKGVSGGGVALIVILAIVAIAVVVGVTYMITSTPTAQQGIRLSGDDGGDGATGLNCNTDPSVTVSAVNALQTGTTISSLTTRYVVDGAYTGTTAPTVAGTSVKAIVNASGYLGSEIVASELKPLKNGILFCGKNTIDAKLYQLANATIQVEPDTALGNGQYLTNSVTAGTTNESASTSGGTTKNWKVHLAGVDKKSTGNQLVVVELSVLANVTSVALEGSTEVTVPNGYSRQLTNGYVKAFEVPALVGGVTKVINLQANAQSGYILTGPVYTTWYTETPYVENDGSIKTGAFDSLNNVEYINSQTYNWVIS